MTHQPKPAEVLNTGQQPTVGDAMSASRAETKAVNPFTLAAEEKNEKVQTSNETKNSDVKMTGVAKPFDGDPSRLQQTNQGSEENQAGKSSVAKSKKKLKKSKRDKKKSKGSRSGIFGDRASYGFDEVFGKRMMYGGRGFYPGVLPFMPYGGEGFYPDPS